MGYVYRVEYVDGWLGRHTSALLTPAQGSVSLLLPDSWTAAGGTGEIRLEAALLGGESSEEQILFTQAGRLYFSPRELGESGPRSREEGLSTLIAACLAATEKATGGGQRGRCAAGRRSARVSGSAWGRCNGVAGVWRNRLPSAGLQGRS